MRESGRERERASHWTHQNVDSWWTSSSAEARGIVASITRERGRGTVCRCLAAPLYDSYNNGLKEVGGGWGVFVAVYATIRSRSTHLLGRGCCQTWTIPLWLIFVCIVLMEFAFHFATHTQVCCMCIGTFRISLNTLAQNAFFRWVYIYIWEYTFVLLFLVFLCIYENKQHGVIARGTRRTQDRAG